MTAIAMEPAKPAGQYDRLLFHIAWLLTAGLFLSIGSRALQPWDPDAPVSLLTHPHPALMMGEALALAVVASAAATLLAGRAHPGVGAFAVGFGLTLVMLREGHAGYLLMHRPAARGLCLLLAAEAMFWSAVAYAALLASSFVSAWTGGSANTADSGTERKIRHVGIKHLALAGGVALILVRVFAAGPTDRAIHHGQACFAVAAAFYLAIGRAQSTYPVASLSWSFLAVPIVTLAAYAWSWATWSSPTSLSSVPPSTFLRMLPLTYIAVGTAAVLLGRWKHRHRHAIAAAS